jgi:hypothetical protein
MSFININNREELNTNSYTKQMIQEALYTTETKNVAKIKTLTEGLNRFTSLNEALTLFSDKLGAMSALSHAKFNFGGTLNEGQFSWMTQDSGEQIGSEKQNTIDVWMYDNQGNVWYEKRYEGYGEFGGMDYYELVATMNGYTEEDLEAIKGPFKEFRQIGIDLAFGKLKTKDKKGKTLFPALVTDPRYNWKRHDFTQEAESDPNQSWYQEPEYDDYEDEYDYDSDEYYESMKTNIKFYKTITKKEWDKAQKDSKTIIDGTHYMMFLDDEKGTILAPVEVTESEDKEVNEGLPDSFLGLPLETFADYYAALDVALAIGVGGVIAGAVLAKLGLDAGVKLFKKGKKAVEDWYTKNGGEVTEGNAFGAARAEAIANGDKEFTVDGETYPVEDVDKEDKENAEEFANEGLTWDTLKEALDINEGRSIGKIQKEWGAVTLDMKKTVEEWKAAEGDRKSELLDKLKALTDQKKSLEAELNDAVGLKDADAELAESLDEAKAVKDFDKAVLDATTEEEVKEIYPDAEFFVSKMTHGFAELAPNLFMKYYYTKGSDFKVHSIYTEKGRDKYVHLFKLDESDKKKLES